MDKRRLLYFILINIFVSICISSIILFWYDRTYRPSTSLIEPTSRVEIPTTVTEKQSEQAQLEIVNVLGAGTLNVETVLIHYNGDSELDLTGWLLRTEDGDEYSFPQLKLFKNGAVQVHTSSGKNTVVDLYWGLSHPVWKPGELVTLLDITGEPRAFYRIP